MCHNAYIERPVIKKINIFLDFSLRKTLLICLASIYEISLEAYL